jgi:diguanylate cyclase
MSAPKLTAATFATFAPEIFKTLDAGILVLNLDMEILFWNRFMETASGHTADELSGRKLFECFTELSPPWWNRKIQTVLTLGQEAFSSRKHKPHVFPLKSRRTVAGGAPWMVQECKFSPLRRDGQIVGVCVTVTDATEVALFEAKLEAALEKVHKLSIHDALTGVYNRRHLDEKLQAEFHRSSRYGSALSVALFDLDHFKKVNDKYGHGGGDETLREVCRRLALTVRETDTLGRFGGEELLLIMPGVEGEQALLCAERLRVVIEKRPVKFGELEIPVTTSIGLSSFQTGQQSPDSLVQLADEALYASKANGRNRVTYAPLKIPQALEAPAV